MKINKIKFIVPALAMVFFLASWTTNTTGLLNETEVETVPGDGKKLDKQPEFAGGNEGLVTFIADHVVYPQEAKKDKIEGTVHVGFIVEASGQVSNVHLKKEVNTLLDNEALRVVKMMPNWEPGEKDGKKVKVEMVVPITFKL